MTTTAEAMYQDPSAAVADRVADLLGRMTLDEKLAQLGSAWVFQLADGDGLDVVRATPLLAGGIGHITRVSGASSLTAAGAATLANDVQRHLREHTRLAIPAIIHEEICSGLMAREAVTFAQAIGVAATFRPEHNRAMADDDPPADALDRSTPGPVARARRVPRPALGSSRGDLRRGSLPRHTDGRRVRARPPGRRSRRRRARHGEALRRVRGVGGGTQLGTRAPPGARAARRLPAPVRSRRS